MQGPLQDELKPLVDEKAAAILRPGCPRAAGPTDPHHLIFSIWATTQHYADFDVQVRAVLGPGHDPFAEAGRFLTTLYTGSLTPKPV